MPNQSVPPDFPGEKSMFSRTWTSFKSVFPERAGDQLATWILAGIGIVGAGVVGWVVAAGPNSNGLQPAPPKPAELVTAAASGQIYWVNTEAIADWTRRDFASTSGLLPKYTVAGTALCDENRLGAVAVCWEDRQVGYPQGVPTDISGTPRQWCTYKQSTVRVSTPTDGGATTRLYVCGRSVPRSQPSGAP